MTPESDTPTPLLDTDRETFAATVDRGDPVVARVEATLPVETTPLSAYAALTGRTTDTEATSHAFLLESAEKVASSDPDGAFTPETADRHARFSFVGYDPDAVITVGPDGTAIERLRDTTAAASLDPDAVDADDPDVLDTLRAALPDLDRAGFPEHDRQQLAGGLVGFLGYDAVYDLWLGDVGLDRPDSRFPDAEFVLTTRTLTFDHVADSVSLVFTPVVSPREDAGAIYDRIEAEAERASGLLAEAAEPDPGGFTRSGETAGPQAAYEDAVRKAKEHVLDGDIYQGVISRTRELTGEIDSLGLYAALRDVNPSPYMYHLRYDDLGIVGASPETLVSVRGREVVSNPIAGTCSRGASPVEDRRLAGEMLADEKERAEHTMLVDLARNDLRRVCESGSVRVQEFMNVLKYSHVQHIESTVTGRLAPDNDAFDATRATFPAGTLSGAPKIRAMEIIDDLERTPRGPYGGGVGYFAWNGDADFAIVIRSATVEEGAVGDGSGTAEEGAVGDGSGTAIDGEDLITVRAGAGLVADSDPTSEYEETESKMDGVLVALERIETEPSEPREVPR
jgi:anthranilate synthase component 1